jgi:hypothetical protein
MLEPFLAGLGKVEDFPAIRTLTVTDRERRENSPFKARRGATGISHPFPQNDTGY